MTQAAGGRVIYAQGRTEMRPFLPERFTRVLEIGCDEGHFCAALDAETWGVEPVAEAAALANARLRNVLVGTFDEVRGALPRGYFDLVICNDVIEHMPDHHRFLREIRHHLTDDGVLVGSIPNVRYYRNLYEVLIGRDWHYQDSGILDRTHLRFFTERSLRRDLTEAGFAIQDFRGINGGLRRLQFGLKGNQFARALFACVLLAFTLGRWRDILWVQFGFRVAAR